MQQTIVPGTVINRRYQIQKKIKDNTSNCCYLAEDTSQSNRLVVLSFPRIELLILPGFANAFRDACANLANSRISGLIKVLDNGLYESQPYAVLQNVTDESLDLVFQRNANSESKGTVDSVLDWATPLAVCLDDLHEADYIHSNVRPITVYIGSQQVLLGDFITEFALQRMGKFKGAINTLNVSDYLAPEYLKSNYMPAYDQYLLATLVYQALANKAPFDDASGGDEYRMQVATRIAEPLLNYRPELSAVSDVLDTALARNPLHRFASCRELISQLQDAQVATPQIVPLKPAVKDIIVPTREEEVPVEPIITSIRNDNVTATAKGKKSLLWLGGILLCSAAVAYTVISLNGADQITSNPDKVKSVTTEVVVPVIVAEPEPQADSIEKKSDVTSTDNKPELQQTNTGIAAVPNQELSGEQLKILIEKEALLAHQENDEAASAVETDSPENSEGLNDKTAEDVAEASKSLPKANDFTGLTTAISQAVSAGQKEFLQSQQQSDESVIETAPEQSKSPIDVVAITQEVVAAVKDQTDTDEPVVDQELQQLDQDKLNQELLAAQALVSLREEEAAAIEQAKQAESEQQRRQPRSRNKVQEDLVTEEVVNDPPVAAQEPNPEVGVSVGSEVTNTTSADSSSGDPEPLSERERIRDFKEKELARIKTVTDECVTGGRVHREAAAGNLAFVKGCMAVGVDPNLAQSNRWTLLHIAARSGHLNMTKLLIAKGVQINAKSIGGLTALDMAIAQKKTKVVRYLRAQGGVTTR